jgi:serine/threonine protein kinase
LAHGGGKAGCRPLARRLGSGLADRHRLQEQIRAGGIAVVFRALDERLDRLVALKLLAQWLAADSAFRQRFLRESRTAAAVDDPHIIPVIAPSSPGRPAHSVTKPWKRRGRERST